jgi:hypothetical protein
VTDDERKTAQAREVGNIRAATAAGCKE